MTAARDARCHSRRSLTGWRVGVASCAAATILAATVNIAFLAAAVSRSVQPIVDGDGTLYIGNCGHVKTAGTWSHLVINLLGILLLGASNYTQQCLVAPTRKEVDEAHRKKKWLDIGVPSFLNLKRIARRRAILWSVLCLSSVPLHLIYNSVIYTEMSAYAYSVYPGTFDDLTNPDVQFPDRRYEWLKQNLGLFTQTLTNAECIAAYANDFVSDRSDVVLVLDVGTRDVANHTQYTKIIDGDPSATWAVTYGWICEDGSGRGLRCDAEKNRVAANPGDWRIRASSVLDGKLKESFKGDHCLSRPAEERCSLKFNVPLLAVVILFNLCKAICMLLSLTSQKDPTLVTLGDAVASFLDNPDPTTTGRCLLSKDNVETWIKDPKPKAWDFKTRRWAQSCSHRRWITIGILYTLVLTTSCGLLSIGMNGMSPTGSDRPNFSELWAMGFGAATIRSLIQINSLKENTIGQMVLLANMPQLILSVLYFTLNGLWTYMLLDVEWNSYGFKRKGLRTTAPVGKQRSTYWLSLPKKYAIPLMVLSALLHWFVSQSIFLVRIMIYRDRDDQPGDREARESMTTCGYSVIGLIFAIILGASLLLLTVAAGLQTMPRGAPTLGACSVVISAACHRPDGDKDAASKRVKWGVLHVQNYHIVDGHCCFSSRDVDRPIENERYE